MRPGRFAPLAAVAVAAALGGCGSESSERSKASELAAALPGDPEYVNYVDLDAYREELGLPEDADPTDLEAVSEIARELERDERQDEPLVRFSGVTWAVLPHVRDTMTLSFEVGAIGEAIDHGRVSAAASAFAEKDSLSAVLQTDQPFEEIAEELEAAGFDRNGEVLSGVSAEPKEALPFVADGGDGRVVVTNTREQAQEAASGAAEEASETVALLDELDQPRRLAGVPPEDSCVTGFAEGADIDPGEIEVVLIVEGGADPERVASEVELFLGNGDVGEPTVDGELIRVSISVPRDDAIDPSQGLGFDIKTLYDCG